MAGKIGPHRESHEPRLLATNFVSMPSGFLEWDGTAGIGAEWGMNNNDVYGDCGPAATDHNNMAKEGSYAAYGQLGMPKFAGTLGTYFAYGIAQGEPGPKPDNGVDNASWLAFLYKNGIIDGYGEVPFAQLDYFAQQFHGAIVGLSIDGNQAIQDFDSSPKVPWAAMPNAVDGHDVLLEITHTDGSGSVITWGGVQPFTAGFRQTNFQDAWVIFDYYDPNVNWAALQAALDEIHGVRTVIPPTLVEASIFQRIEHLVEREFAHLSAA
jgi:hypothetical protein